ncbi:antitoxin Xre/MbcA/ParS toxin-binding domain-containing protein [Halomonas alkaliantarctica]|uniref:antitoxin Xre/MbcA/ParS toxin-binding domain-containing protein n=1 Tax=Halomonas alkaliantarctica TaxID=232346 RepID=UPI0004ABA27B|nr:antitoxin Xre/MbcA/ParS toxin-binding domain-containing protein [Halomonas alkaliantarctica]
MPEPPISPLKAGNNKREIRTAEFWRFITAQAMRKESERLQSIQEGLSPTLLLTVQETFQLQDKQVKALFNVSVSAVHRRRREGKNLNSVTSERLDRVATVNHLAMVVFEDKLATINWMSSSNEALGGQAPVMLCGTDIEAKQVRRLLLAMECGGVA